jgi:putative peptide zinc metalloprotease protein
MVIEPTPMMGKVPRLAAGVELIGEYQDSGFHQPRYLVRRADGQVLQLSRLLYLLAATVDGQRDQAQVASLLSAEFGKVVRPEQVGYLLDTHLRPVGIIAADPQLGDTDTADSHRAPGGGASARTAKSDPLLGLRFKVGVVPESVVWRIAGVFTPMFWPPVILAMLAGFVGLDVLIIAQGGLGQIVPSAVALVYQPALTLLVLALMLASAVFHECGHVSACRYGGARPGVMGFGLYLVWPALYSTVTDSYRLGRLGRLRTDLGGVYFNAVSIIGMSAAYLTTRTPWLLLAIVALHIETATQFLPMIRFDGYYILSDLIGVPDLLRWTGPVLASIIPGRAAHPRVLELKPWARRTITLWVLIVIPYLLYWLVGLLVMAPQVLPLVGQRLVELSHALSASAAAYHLAETTLDMIQIVLLVLPWAGTLLILGMMARQPVRWLATRYSPPWPRGRNITREK